MRALVLLFLFGHASAQSLVPIPDAENPCLEYGCRYYEWRIEGIANVRYVASGYDDGIDYSLYRVAESGDYELLLRINPVAVDDNGAYFWGYAWVTTDIVLDDTGTKPKFLATFEHDIVREGVISVPDWQKELPAILFKGQRGNSSVELGQFEFKVFDIEELLTHAKGES